MLNEESGFIEKKEIYLDDYIEQIKRKFYQKGFDDGKKHLQDQVLNIVGIFKKATEKLEMEKNSLIKKGEKQLIRVAIAIAKKIIRKEVSVDPESPGSPAENCGIILQANHYKGKPSRLAKYNADRSGYFTFRVIHKKSRNKKGCYYTTRRMYSRNRGATCECKH